MKTKRTLSLVSGILLILLAVGAIITAVAIFALKAPIVEALEQILNEMVATELGYTGELTPEQLAEIEKGVSDIMGMVGMVFIPFGAGALLGGVIHAVFGGLLIAHSRKSDEIVATKKTLLILTLVFSILTSNLLVMILIICALAKKVEVEQNNFETVAPVNNAPVAPVAPVVNNTPVTPVASEPTVAPVVEPVVEPVAAQPSAQDIVANAGSVDEKVSKLKAMRDSGAISQEEYVELLKKLF